MSKSKRSKENASCSWEEVPRRRELTDDGLPIGLWVDNGKLRFGPIPSRLDTTYYDLAGQILGEEPEEILHMPQLDPPAVNVGGLSDRDDQRLGAMIGMSPADWGALNEDQRIGRMRAYLASVKPAEKVESEIADGTQFASLDEVPAEFREGREPDGEPLTVAYLKKSRFLLQGPYLSKHYKGKRVRVGKSYVYQFDAIVALADIRTEKQDD